MTDGKGEAADPALGISLELQYAGGRKVVFQTFVARETPQEGIDAILDRLNGSADRAEAYYAQEQAKRQLEVEENAQANIVRRLSEVEGNIQLKASQENRRGGYRPSVKDEMDKKQAHDTVEESRRRVKACRDHLDELIRKAGDRDGTSSAANR